MPPTLRMERHFEHTVACVIGGRYGELTGDKVSTNKASPEAKEIGH